MSIDLLTQINELKKENKKLSLESKLRKSMSAELDRQKELLRKSREDVEIQKNKIEKKRIYKRAPELIVFYSNGPSIYRKGARHIKPTTSSI